MPSQKKVEFKSGSHIISGILIVPDGASGPVPVVVMGGGWCYVKEIVMPHYAKGIVAAGAAVLMFDYRNFGESSGTRRQHIDPWEQIEDFRSAVTYAETLPEIDPRRIGVWGISYAGGHVIAVAAIDSRVKLAVSNIPVVNGYETMRRTHGSTRFNDLEDLLLEDRRGRAKGHDGRMPMSSLTPPTELSTWPFPTIHSVFNDIKAREAPNHEHWSTIESTELLLNYDVGPFARRIYDKPILFVIAEGDEITLWDLEIATYHSVPSAQKELAVIPKVSHMSLYSQQDHLSRAGAAASAFIRKHLVDA
ncbi:UNVERIFIED_ORG: cephalosporin-C deacetylase-like acetyl esterase [Xanthobacter viscosus]|uniref:Acetylxylan esterase n=1 Tax=Xanthobacter autotrophicus TaxID=280 RepID=A0A6C1KCY5_XANAU|nr:alpha/beta fold hydrolase [Xanthobacter autotrophicus]TLX41407.1 acetylxylan esterase [Xanthobacter autotrophicus]